VDECKPLAPGAGVPGAHLPPRAGRGRAVQVDPIKPKLKPPGTKRLKLTYGEPLSDFAFKFNLRRYDVVRQPLDMSCLAAGAYTR